MGLTVMARAALASTAIAPVGFIAATSAFWRGDMTTAGAALLATLALTALCLRLLRAIRGPYADTPAMHQIRSIEPVERTNAAIILLYAAPVLTPKTGPDWSVWVPTLAARIVNNNIGLPAEGSGENIHEQADAVDCAAFNLIETGEQIQRVVAPLTDLLSDAVLDRMESDPR